jgi:hypothetical protein
MCLLPAMEMDGVFAATVELDMRLKLMVVAISAILSQFVLAGVTITGAVSTHKHAFPLLK